MEKIRVAVLFGSRSVEHEVSVVTAMQVFEWIDREKYDVIPVFIDKAGRWWTGRKLDRLEYFKDLNLAKKTGLKQVVLSSGVGERKLITVGGFRKREIRVDIILPAIHGTFGEDGTIQGYLEMMDIPYTGCGVTASAVGMDKIIQKAVFEAEGIPVVKYDWFTKEEWEKGSKDIMLRLEKNLGYPMFVKPANLGSSVGINIARDQKGLKYAIEVAKEFDTRILVERGLAGIDEINVSVMGVDDLTVSVCEQPIKHNKLLTYEDKYLKGGKTKGMASLSRLVPAPIKESLAKKIQNYALKAYRAIGGSGLSRIDFLTDIKLGKVYLCEINTLPGSMAFYLWENSNLPFDKMIDRLIEQGFERYEKRKKINFVYESNLLKMVEGGSKVSN